MTLTALAIKHLKPRAEAYRVADSGSLCLEVSPSGGKLWRYRYQFHGKAQMLALGKYPEVSLQEARQKRDEARALVKAGKHPTREKNAEKLRRTVDGEHTFERVARSWMELKGKNLNAKYHKQSLARMEHHIFPMIGALPITEITIPDVARVVEKIGKRGIIETAHRMKQIMSQVSATLPSAVFASLTQLRICGIFCHPQRKSITPVSTQENSHNSCRIWPSIKAII